MDNQNVITQKTHTGENFVNKQLMSQKVTQKQNVWKWLALIGAFLFQAIPYGVSSNILGNMQPFVVQGGELVDGSRYAGIFDSFVLFTLVFTFGSVFSAIFTPLLGKMFGKVDLKVLLGVGNIVSGGAFAMIGLLGFLFSPGVNNEALYAQRAAWLYSWYGICLVGTSIFSGLGIPFIIGAWFPGKNRGTMLGVAFAGGSAGNLIWQVAISQTLKVIPVWDAFYIYGAVAVVVGVLISFLLIRTPKTFNLGKQTLGTVNPQLSHQQDIQANGAGINTTLTIPWFYVLCLSYMVFGLGIAAVASQWPTFLRSGLKTVVTDLNPGNVQNYFANVMSVVGIVYGIACLLGNLTGGIIFSRLGVSSAFLIGGSLRCVGSILMLLGVFNPYLIAIGVGISGFTCYTYTSAVGFMSTNLFGRKDSSVVIGILGIFFAVGFAISTPLISAIQGPSTSLSYFAGKDMNGNWLGVWIFSAVVSIIGGLLVAFSANKIHKMGYLGMSQANYSRFGRLVMIYSLPIYFKALKIWVSGNDERLTQTYLNLMHEKTVKWDQVKNEKINKENTYYSRQIDKLAQKSKLKVEKLQAQLAQVQQQISSLKLSDQEIAKSKQAVAKLNAAIQKAQAKNVANYNHLIAKIEAKNTNHGYDGLLAALTNDTEVDNQYYDNPDVIQYFVKYAALQMKIDAWTQKIEVVQNKPLAKLNVSEKKLQRSVMIAQATQVYKQDRNSKVHNQILAFYQNKYLELNNMIDARVALFEQHKVTHHHDISVHHQTIADQQNQIVSDTQAHYQKISDMWANSDIHHSLTTLSEPEAQPASN